MSIGLVLLTACSSIPAGIGPSFDATEAAYIAWSVDGNTVDAGKAAQSADEQLVVSWAAVLRENAGESDRGQTQDLSSLVRNAADIMQKRSAGTLEQPVLSDFNESTSAFIDSCSK
ncbi:hypothetical protein E3O62_12260 [Cryobacterium sp. TMT2-15-1]|uniref:hypothetical protein n=1 Tax=Cryobacterium sp. TMT2-15-1 TaxID=1259246 RepID=UPI00106986E0|nr:hypothetical protein [Cryobacterium sp. TMT2-15-1]TFC56641.1 hypothetical protein E3O62_12260 [Cryobacterium sp. TMT2-15-1]